MTKISEIKLNLLKDAEYMCIFMVKNGNVTTSESSIHSFEEVLDTMIEDENNNADQTIDDLYIKVNDFFISDQYITPDSKDGKYLICTIRIK